jgi:hypothetical protein
MQETHPCKNRKDRALATVPNLIPETNGTCVSANFGSFPPLRRVGLLEENQQGLWKRLKRHLDDHRGGSSQSGTYPAGSLNKMES